jgi:hypothetical protein
VFVKTSEKKAAASVAFERYIKKNGGLSINKDEGH